MTTYRDYTQVGGWWRGSLPIVYKLSGRLAEWLKGFTKSTNKNWTQRFVITTKSIALGSIRSHYTPSTVLVVEPPVRRVYVATYVSWAVGTTTVFTLSRRPTQFEADGIPYPLPSEQRIMLRVQYRTRASWQPQPLPPRYVPRTREHVHGASVNATDLRPRFCRARCTNR